MKKRNVLLCLSGLMIISILASSAAFAATTARTRSGMPDADCTHTDGAVRAPLETIDLSEGLGSTVPLQPTFPFMAHLPIAFNHYPQVIIIPAGEFRMGCDDRVVDENCNGDEEPDHIVYLDQYAIDKYEVTNAQYAEFLNTAGNQEEGGDTWLDADDPSVRIHQDGTVWQANAGYEDHPVVEVTWYGARAYCQSRGGRLPTEAEWEKAARGSGYARIYPWGNADPDCSRLNCVVETQYCVADTSPVGSYSSGASAYGLLDMGGNAAEWVNDWYDSRYYATSPYNNPQGPPTGFHKMARGGSWRGLTSEARVAYRGIMQPDASRYYIGFRCVNALPGQ